MKSSNEYHNDAAYEIWRRGGNPDRLSYDRSYNDWSDGKEPEQTANNLLRQEREERDRRRDIENEEQWNDFYNQQSEEEMRQQEQEYYADLEQQFNAENVAPGPDENDLD